MTTYRIRYEDEDNDEDESKRFIRFEKDFVLLFLFLIPVVVGGVPVAQKKKKRFLLA